MPLTRNIAKSLMLAVIPERGPATIYLNPVDGTPETVNVSNAWIKPSTGRLGNYGRFNVENGETIIKVPDFELNPAGNGREIRTNDDILFAGTLYTVTQAGGGQSSVRTVWNCSVQPKVV